MGTKVYTGIGSRETPAPIIAQMSDAALRLAVLGWVLRSGHAMGADAAFEIGADSVKGAKKIFLPWKGFLGSGSPLFNAPPAAFALAEKVHPAWHHCNERARQFHARNCQQVLGENLDEPSQMVVAWTKDGKLVGGTATALRIALDRGIPIFNFAKPPAGYAATAEDVVRFAVALCAP